MAAYRGDDAVHPLAGGKAAPVGGVAHFRFLPKKPAVLEYKKKRIDAAQDDRRIIYECFEPFVVCRAEDLLGLAPEDFDAVICFADAGTSPRWIREAMRVGGESLTVFFGMVNLS